MRKLTGSTPKGDTYECESRRKSDGTTPYFLRKALEKVVASRNPTRTAMSKIAVFCRSAELSKCLALSSRASRM